MCTEHSGTLTVLADSFDRRPFNSPNDGSAKQTDPSDSSIRLNPEWNVILFYLQNPLIASALSGTSQRKPDTQRDEHTSHDTIHQFLQRSVA
jgi:hypothetical protein